MTHHRSRPPPILITARWLMPLVPGAAGQVAPPVEDAAVAMAEGRIVAVGRAVDVRTAVTGATTTDLGDAILLPGLVNAHAHLELSHVRRPVFTGRFIDWLGTVMTGGPTSMAAAGAAIADGAAASLRAGVTSVLDITRWPDATYGGDLRRIVFGEVTGLGPRAASFAPMLDAAIRAGGISPHAPYSVDRAGYANCLAAALPLMTHLAETPAEREFIRDGTGDFAELWNRIAPGTRLAVDGARSPVQMAADVGLLDRADVLLAHCNDLDDADIALLAGGRARVVFCPRTHAYFGRPPHRYRELLAAGADVALGTDSLASNPDLDVMAEVRALAGTLPPATLLGLATWRSGRSAGLAVGAPGDVVAYAVTGDALDAVMGGSGGPVGVWVRGRRV